MKIGIFHNATKSIPEHTDTVKAFGSVLNNVDYLNLEDGYSHCDIAITFGVPKTATKRGKLVETIFEEHQGRNLVIEKGYVKRNKYYSIGWDGLNGRADFMNSNSPSDRWEKLGVYLQPKSQGKSILVCGQIPWDAAVQHVDYLEWCDSIVERLQRTTERKIIFRPHPLQKKAVYIEGVVRSTGNNIKQDLNRSFCSVAFNSNSGVESIIKGVPTFAFDEGSMVFDVANTDLKKINSPSFPEEEERKQWAHNLAYAQWTIDEMYQGLPQRHLGLI